MTRTAVLGLGGTIDFEVHWDAAILESLAAELGVVDLGASAPRVIDSERHLVLSILHHMRTGTGGEHFVAAPEIIEQFASRFGYRTTLGGTPVRAAIAMSMLGVGSVVHLVSINEDVRRLLPADVRYMCSADGDSTDPHLILQYPARVRIRLGRDDVVSPGPNRLIYPCDRPNAEMRLSPELPEALRAADVFLVSGLNSIQERGLLEARLGELIDAMGNLGTQAVTFYESGGFHVPEFSQLVLDALAAHLDIVSLNEDELMEMVARPVDPADPTDLVAAVRELAAHVPGRAIVLHTRHFALAHGRHTDRMRAALANGIAVSGARYLHGDGATREDVALLDSSAPRSPVGRLVADALGGDDEFCVVPAFDLQNVTSPTTIGLGDSFVGGVLAAIVTEGLELPTDAMNGH